MEAATEAATHLYNKGEGQWGTCEEAFIELLCACSPVQTEGYGSGKRHASVWGGLGRDPSMGHQMGWIEGGEIGSAEAN